MTKHKTNLRKGRLLFTIAVFIGFFLLLYYLCKPMLPMLKEPEKLRAFIDSKGTFGLLTFVLLVLFEVLFGVIPAGPFQIAGGYIFGTFKGILIYDLSAALGSLMAYFLAKTFGIKLLLFLFDEEEVIRLKNFIHGKNIPFYLFMIYLIPGLPKDIFAYLSGLTDIKWYLMFSIAFIARIPSILMSVFSGNSLANGDLTTLIICTLIIAIISVIAKFVFDKIQKAEQDKQNN